MHQNVGFNDRLLRILLAAVAASVLLTRGFSGPVLLAWMVAPLVLLITGATGFSPIYAVLGLSTHHPPLQK
ncbi:DUF2892 domain-containing protein [Hymenobacter sp. BT770]|uniref:YgaP family membrane protein n=1 Tax=Hymenobacter sp. BT770 TaxID=2886942 RepID=UPI001D11A5FD|nr:DUF2892 domain-containing protein [Hymenobacter sp. BT770]MCC3155162.1 DUF2892 domain-containing protein [Hymenobacter sp. BT770]MDO3417210.1 DUF2892 domain-containing protein [Hymenobacter sp. BT770]